MGDADGNLHVYDLKRSRGRPEATLKVRVAALVVLALLVAHSPLLPFLLPQVTSDRSPVYAVAFNPRSPQLVATADGQGWRRLFELSLV